MEASPKREFAITRTGQCQRYQAYETRPMYRATGFDSADPLVGQARAGSDEHGGAEHRNERSRAGKGVASSMSSAEATIATRPPTASARAAPW